MIGVGATQLALSPDLELPESRHSSWGPERNNKPLDRVQLKLNLRDAGFGVGRKAGTRRNSNAISRVSNTANDFESCVSQVQFKLNAV